MPEDRGKAGALDEVPEEVLAELNGARKGHVAEEEQTEQQARNGLSHVKVGRPLACALGVLERNTGDHFVRSRRMSELDLFRSRHD